MEMADMASYYYHQHIGNIRKLAKEYGYAIGVHGSKSRDIDLIAVPWVESVQSPMKLAEAICELVGGTFSQSLQPGFSEKGCPGKKPHGRLGWCINFGDGVYIDLAIIPPTIEEGLK